MDETTFLPRPVQRPRIPIWVGGSALRDGPVRRAARCDSMAPVPVSLGPGEERYLTPTEVRALRATIEQERGANRPFDIAIGGLVRGVDWAEERDRMAALAEAGATWWLEWVPAADLATMRAAIERGPLRPQ